MMNLKRNYEYIYSYAVRSDIAVAIICESMYVRQVFSKAENTLEEVFSKWEDFKINHMGCIRTEIECKAN